MVSHDKWYKKLLFISRHMTICNGLGTYNSRLPKTFRVCLKRDGVTRWKWHILSHSILNMHIQISIQIFIQISSTSIINLTIYFYLISYNCIIFLSSLFISSTFFLHTNFFAYFFFVLSSTILSPTN